MLLDLVCAEAAASLGATAESIGPRLVFSDAGLDSLVAVELRNRLEGLTGLRLPATLTFDQPTPADVAGFLADELAEELSGLDRAAAGSTVTDGLAVTPAATAMAATATAATAGTTTASTAAASTVTAAAAPGTATANGSRISRAADGPLATLYRRLIDRGEFAAAAELIAVASRLRSTFTAAEIKRHVKPSIQLASGGADVKLICFPAVSAISGPHEYARFGHSMQGERDVHVLATPGYDECEALPDSFETFVQMQTDTVQELVAGGGAFALAGRSMGGCIAHAVAVELERRGLGPAGLVLIDAYTIGSEQLEQYRDWWLEAMLTAMVERTERYRMVWSDASLTSMGGYGIVLSPWQPEPLAARTLCVRAAEPLAGTIIDPSGRLDWRPFWPLPHEVTDVPGDHFTVLESHADTTAAAVRTWLDSLT